MLREDNKTEKQCVTHLRKIEYYCKDCNINLCVLCYQKHSTIHKTVQLDTTRRTRKAHCEFLSKEKDIAEKFWSKLKSGKVWHYNIDFEHSEIIIYFLEDVKESYVLKINFNYSLYWMISECVSIGTKIFYIRKKTSALANIYNLCELNLDSNLFPEPYKINECVEKYSNAWNLIPFRTDLYIFSGSSTYRYSTISGKKMKIASLQTNNTNIFLPTFFQDRYLIGAKFVNNPKDQYVWQTYILDILDQSEDWKLGPVFEVSRRYSYSNYRDYIGIFAKGTNNSVYFIYDISKQIEINIDSALNNKESIKYIENEKIGDPKSVANLMDEPHYYKGKIWLTEKNTRDLITFDYKSRKFNVIEASEEFKQFKIVPKKSKKIKK